MEFGKRDFLTCSVGAALGAGMATTAAQAQAPTRSSYGSRGAITL